MSADLFIDSNVAVYALGMPSLKRDIARQLISKKPIISTQVVMETVNVLVKKFKFERANAFEAVTEIIDKTELRSTTPFTLAKAFEISLRYQVSHWDGLIITAALEANCSTLYSEDMQHGLIIENKLSIVNPFI
ncbi:MAG: PIN domain-containing protein [Cyclobacteriaceae bacterium]|nr:PIN domain-containing protein [Cyclobacteriaceae bacterium]